MKFILSGGGGMSFNNNLAKMFLSVAFKSFLVLHKHSSGVDYV